MCLNTHYPFSFTLILKKSLKYFQGLKSGEYRIRTDDPLPARQVL